MSEAEAPGIQLLLCDAGDRAPVLEDGLDAASLRSAQAPDRGPRGKDSMHLEALDRDPNDLEAQRWAVIAPEGAAGEAALRAIEALIAHRGAQQGADPFIYRVPAGMDAAAALSWKNDVLRSEDVPLDERPRYVLILGDLAEVSLELQHVLANGSFVGRLHCPTPQGYRAYAEKVVAREQAPPSARSRSLFYTAQDGTAAVGVGYRHLIEPCMRMQGDLVTRGKLVAEAPSEIPYSEWGPDELLAEVGVDAPSLLCSVSHGLGAPRRGWRSPAHQRALQGALAIGADEPLSADMVREAAFLPGGVWFCVACYGAGTPPESAYHSWLALLAAGGKGKAQLDGVLRSLPNQGDAPFVAALPQALLANPQGPLAVIGHMDLAWTYGFTDPESKQSRASRMLATQRAILAGSRVGVGLDALMHAYRETNDDLMARYQLQRDAVARGQEDPVPPRQLGELWMQRNDLRGYVLLGDPAARLGIVPGRPVAQAEAAEIEARPRAAKVARSPAQAASSAPPPPATEAASFAASAPESTAKIAPEVVMPSPPPPAMTTPPPPTTTIYEPAPLQQSHAPAQQSPSPAPATVAVSGAAATVALGCGCA
jgi:hypothetical protein